MIDYTSVRRSFETLIAATIPTLPIQNENKKLDVTNVSEYVALFDQEATSEPFETGSDIVLVSGGVVIQIFTSLGDGTERSREIASILSNAMNTLETDTLNFGTAVLNSVGQVEESNFYQQNLTIPYRYAYAGNEAIPC